MASYKIFIEARAEKELRKLPIAARKEVSETISKLATNPRPTQARKMVGSPGWRLRVGNYRVIYEIEDKIISIFIVKVGHRREVYRNL